MSRFKAFKVIDEAAAEKGSFDKFFDTGLHVTKISKIEDMGQSAKDPTWLQIKATFEGAGGKTINKWIMVPTEHEYYGEPGKLGAFNGLMRFLEAIVPFKDGKTPVKVSNVYTYLSKYFDAPEKALVGLNIEIKVGHDKHFAQYLEKDLYELQTKDGKAVLDENDEPIRANTYGAIEQQAKVMRLPYNNFREVLGFGAPQVNAKSPSKIVVKAKIEDEEDDEDTIF